MGILVGSLKYIFHVSIEGYLYDSGIGNPKFYIWLQDVCERSLGYFTSNFRIHKSLHYLAFWVIHTILNSTLSSDRYLWFIHWHFIYMLFPLFILRTMISHDMWLNTTAQKGDDLELELSLCVIVSVTLYFLHPSDKYYSTDPFLEVFNLCSKNLHSTMQWTMCFPFRMTENLSEVTAL
jgi:hypothetical protein